MNKNVIQSRSTAKARNAANARAPATRNRNILPDTTRNTRQGGRKRAAKARQKEFDSNPYLGIVHDTGHEWQAGMDPAVFETTAHFKCFWLFNGRR